MQKFQLTLQKFTVYGSVVLAAITIAYALGFSTDLHSLSYHVDEASRLLYVPGAELYTEAQPFNRLFFLHSIGLFAVCITMFVTLTHRRRLYYPANYITGAAFAGYAVYTGCLLAEKSNEYKEMYIRLKDGYDYQHVAQRIYEQKYNVDFRHEMNRATEEYIKKWR